MHPSYEHTLQLAYELANRPLSLVIIETGLLVIIALVAFFGNTCVLYVFYKMPTLRTVTSYYIITLAISDILMALFVMPATIVTSSFGRNVVGETVGPIVGATGYALVFGSLQTTSLIAVNRFFCVVKRSAYKKYFKPNFVIIMIVVVWILAILHTVVVNACGWAKMAFSPGKLIHAVTPKDKTTNEVFSIFSLFVFLCLPMSLTAVCYWKVYKTVKIHNASVSSTINPINTLSSEEICITKTVLAIVCGFVLCWVPCSIVVLLSVYVDLPRYAEMIFTYTAYLSSAINPIIFNAFNKTFRRHMKKELFRRGKIEDGSVTAHARTVSVQILDRSSKAILSKNVNWGGERRVELELPSFSDRRVLFHSHLQVK